MVFGSEQFVNDIDHARGNGDMGDTCVAFLFLFLPVVSSEFGIGSSRGISGLDECPSEEFSTTGFRDVSFGFFPC